MIGTGEPDQHGARIMPQHRQISAAVGCRAAALSLAALWLVFAAAGCNDRPATTAPAGTPVSAAPLRAGPFRLLNGQTVPELGAAQGVTVRDGQVYLYGDAEVGVVREYDWSQSKSERGDVTVLLSFTGREIRLTQNGVDRIPHPTGIAFAPDGTTFMGDTVKGVGTIYRVDWPRALTDGNLDRAILQVILDDAAVRGTRPAYLDLGDGLAGIVTSDYGDTGNALRLYRIGDLMQVQRTSEALPVLRSRCGPWVQNVAFEPRRRAIVLVQNQIEGLRWRLTVIAARRFRAGEDFRLTRGIDFAAPADELEGFAMLDDRLCVFVTASSVNNVWFGVWE
jgi:hypothetical protein